MLFFVFREYIFLQKLYLFGGAAGDSITYTYPHFVHDSEYFKNTGFPGWTFSLGMGQNTFPISVTDPFSLLVSLTSKENLQYALAYVEILKIFLIGLFSFLFLQELKLTPFSSIVAALLFAFSGYTLLHGGWYFAFSAHAVYVLFLLFAFEKLLKNGIWYWFPIPVALVASLSSFYLLLDCELLLLYSILRYGEEHEWKVKGVSIFALRLGLIGSLGILIGSVCLISGMLLLLESPRVSGNLVQTEGIISNPVFKTDSFDDLMISVLRMFSTDIFGADIKSPFKSDPRYMERNIAYCGLLTLFLVPQLFHFLDKKRKIIYGCVLSFFVLGFIFPYVRHMFWFFSGDYYRIYSLFFAILLVYYAALALSGIDKHIKINRITLIVTTSVLLVVLNYKYEGEGLYKIIDPGLKQTITYLLCIIPLCLLLMANKKWRPYMKTTLLLIVIGELCHWSGITVTQRVTFSAADLKQKAGYNDFTNEAAALTHSMDKSFFRSAKDYYSGFGPDSDLNTQQYQGYYGTSCYNSFNQPAYLAFLYTMGIDTNLFTAARSQGLNNKFILQTWASVKYYFVKNPQTLPVLKPMGYDSIGRTGDVTVLRNRMSLPLGFCYENFVTEDDFSKADFLQKNKILLNAFVVKAEEKEKYSGFREVRTDSFPPANISLEEYLNPIKTLKEDTFAITNYTQNRFQGTIDLEEKKLLFLSIPFDKGWKVIVNGKEHTLEKVNIGFMGLILDKGHHEIVLEFTPYLLETGAWLSLFGILIYCLGLWKVKKLPPVAPRIVEKVIPHKSGNEPKKKKK